MFAKTTWLSLAICSVLTSPLLEAAVIGDVERPLSQQVTVIDDLTYGYWVMDNARDTVNYAQSKLYFDSQELSGDAYTVSGYFDWMSTDRYHYGQEYFTGTYDPLSGHLDMRGQYLRNASGIGLAHYWADLSTDGAELTNGRWSSPSGVWHATQVPEPATCTLLLLGGAAGLLRRRKVRV